MYFGNPLLITRNQQGEHVTLPCQVENKRGMLQWTRDGFGLGIERNLTGFDRYHMVGSDEEGEEMLNYKGCHLSYLSPIPSQIA